MTGYLEIEKKYQVENESLEPLLQYFKYEGDKRVDDEYFDTVDGEWYQRGIFIRIRNGKSLDIKFNPDHLGKSGATDHVSCHEYSFNEPFGEMEQKNLNILQGLIGLETAGVNSFRSLLNKNKLETLLLIDKLRKSYSNDDFTVVIDTIQGLGFFLEIEYSGPEGRSLDSVIEEIDTLMEGTPAKPLASGSFEMILRKVNFELYRKGKYLLEEDLESKVA